MEITKDTLIGDIIKEKPEAVETLMSFGLACVGCPGSQLESVEQAAQVHGIDVDALITALNK